MPVRTCPILVIDERKGAEPDIAGLQRRLAAAERSLVAVLGVGYVWFGSGVERLDGYYVPRIETRAELSGIPFEEVFIIIPQGFDATLNWNFRENIEWLARSAEVRTYMSRWENVCVLLGEFIPKKSRTAA